MPVARRGRPAPVLLTVAALLGAALAACDAAPGIPGESARPVIEDVRVTPLRDSLASSAPTAEVPLVVETEVGGAGPITVRVRVRYAETDSLAGQAEVEVEPGPVRVEVPLALPRGATGAYDVVVTTEGPDGRLGDEARAVFRFAATNLGPPVVAVNPPLPRPLPTGQDTVQVPIVAAVSDPDGIANVALVIVRDPESGRFIGRLLDDGEGKDEVAGDGVYSAAIEVGSGFPPGTYALEVVAVDRAEAVSEPARFTFTIQ
ncbi:choice-of-anchor X domain-containing protein [Rubrivirga sp. S365]|uniref:Choice-of-anchor X domain-containing protein n=1 Tax=Rubrivirga litoralis TaxID=3075598 RepID=A0ABU3BS66_9BACT|nr:MULTISPECIES: choice-of-anchor X domain-containing protein [unclassified Rubrivirga]MDT0632108.1 choice-of-anchor X domain-containing protein [Rubrivirga sp. F394]MDT7856186.1 choice-of-anchor X domain-containing protein [Rubrivirga sp. S365]